MTKRAFAICAHPDDIEFFMAGTMLLLKEAGYEIHFMNIASGSCGTMNHDVETISKIRLEEARKACEVAGAIHHKYLVNDIEIFYEHKTLQRLSSVFREVAPEIVLTHSPSDYMEDHMNASRLAVSAAFNREMPNYPVDPHVEPVHDRLTIYHAQPHSNRDPLRNMVWPEFYVDISSVIELKTNCLAEHQSQKKWLDDTQGMDSYLKTMQGLSREVGEMSSKFEYAEGWRRHNWVGFADEEFNPVVDALSKYVHINPDYPQA